MCNCNCRQLCPTPNAVISLCSDEKVEQLLKLIRKKYPAQNKV